MLKKALTATLSCLKKTCAAAVTFAVRFVRFGVELGTRLLSEIASGARFLKKKLTPPTKEELNSDSMFGRIKAGVKLAMLQRFFLFLGGLVCVFLLPEESRGDLTYFERLLTSSKDFLSNTSKALLNKITMNTTSWLSAKVGDFVTRC